MGIEKKPPTWADRFLAWYCRADRLEEIQGDVYELYFRMVKENKHKADLIFVWNVLRFFRIKNIRRSTSKNNHANFSLSMLKNYLLIGFRNSLKNGSSFINIAGLSLGIAITITTFIFLDHQFSMDNFHANKDRIYQVTNNVSINGHLENWSESPYLLAPALKNDFASVEAFCRVEQGGGIMRYNDNVFNEAIWFVDASFMSMFSYPMIEGSTSALLDKSHIVVTDEIAEKYFGKETALGKPVSIKFSDTQKYEFTIGAVIKKPYNSGFYFSILLPMEALEDLKAKDFSHWRYLTDATFIMMKEGHTANELAPSLKKYKDYQNASSPEWIIEGFNFFSFKDLTLHKSEIMSGVTIGVQPTGLIALGVISLLLLLLACFNYMNISIATVSTRLKEIGIRKVVGGSKKEIIQQFLIENMTLCFIALIVGFFLAYYFILPGFDSIVPINIPFQFSSVKVLLLFFTALLIFIATVSGMYPALYVSNFSAVQIIKGKEKFGQKSMFSRALLTVQFFLAFTTIVGSFVLMDNCFYQNNKDWGYDHDQNYIIPFKTQTEYLTLRDKLKDHNGVISLAGSANHIGFENSRFPLVYKGERHQIIRFRVGFDYLETMNLRLSEGRFFDKSIQADNSESVIITKQFAKKMRWDHPLYQTFELDSIKRTVIGVVEDFYYDNFYNPMEPAIFTIAPEKDLHYIVLKLKATEADLIPVIKKTWEKTSPDDPFSGFFQKDVMGEFYKDNNSIVMIFSFLSGTVLIISCLGLFGLVSYNITRRLKEFSIRKIFGANGCQILNLMQRDYLWMLLISFLLGAPLGYFAANAMIHQIYPDPQEPRTVPFLIAILSMASTITLTIALQIRRVIKENPVSILKID